MTSRTFVALLGIAGLSIIADDIMSGRLGTESGVPAGPLMWLAAVGSVIAVIIGGEVRTDKSGALISARESTFYKCGIIGVVFITAVMTWPLVIRHNAYNVAAVITEHLTNAIGVATSRRGGILSTSGQAGYLEFAASPENIRLTALFAFTAGACTLLASKVGWARAAASVVLIAGLTLAIRFAQRIAVLAAESAPDDSSGEWWGLRIGDSTSTAIALTVASIVLVAATGSEKLLPWQGQSAVKPGNLLAVGGVSTFVAAGSLAWFDPGAARPGRIVVDDHLSGAWEQSAKLLSESWFGDMSTYSLSSAVEYLGWGWDVVVSESEDALVDSLSHASVVVIKTPQVEMPQSLIRRVHEFVEHGGGLLLIGDHTDLMGINTTLNALAQPAGITFKFDAVMDAKTRGFNLYSSNLGTTHPIAIGVDRLEFMTSCSLGLAGKAKPVMTVARAVGQKGDYSNNSNFGALEMDGASDCGRLVVAASAELGRGRVVAFTDSTVLSSFAFFGDNREKLIDRAIDYLSRTNSPLGVVSRCAVASALALALVCAIWTIRENAMFSVGVVGTIWPFLGALGWILAGRLNSIAYGEGRAEGAAPRIGVLMTYSEAAIPPALGGTGELDLDWAYDTAYCAISRTGHFPKLIYHPSSELAELIWLVPGGSVAPDVLNNLRDWLQEGGHLLVVVRNDHQHLEAPNELSSPWQARITSIRSIDEAGLDLGRAARDLRKAMEVHQKGFRVEPLPFKGMLLLTLDCGSGKLSILLGGEWLSRKRLGHCFSFPDRARLLIYKSWFSALRSSGVGRPADRRTYRSTREPRYPEEVDGE